MLNKNNQVIKERKQEKLDSGFMSEHYPEVESIVISMVYRQKGARLLNRTMYFYPDSYAFFKVTCLSNDCVDGGFDMTRIIKSMISSHSKASKGELGCDDSGPRPDHSSIAYEVAIQYT